jgi:hypothetical protein
MGLPQGLPYVSLSPWASTYVYSRPSSGIWLPQRSLPLFSGWARFPSVIQSTVWVLRNSSVTPLLAPVNCETALGSLAGRWKGPAPWRFVRDPNSSGNSPTTRRSSQDERERLGYVCNPRSLSTGNGDVSSLRHVAVPSRRTGHCSAPQRKALRNVYFRPLYPRW